MSGVKGLDHIHTLVQSLKYSKPQLNFHMTLVKLAPSSNTDLQLYNYINFIKVAK